MSPNVRASRLAVAAAMIACAIASAAGAGQPAWRSLFNGKDLSGWRAVGKAKWIVSDGMLVGTQGDEGQAGDLLTTESFADFELSVTFKCQWPCNSGVWFRYQNGRIAYQADVLEWKNPVCWTGTLYCPPKMFLAMNKDPKLVKKDDWNTFLIGARGDHLTIDLNGTRVADVHDDLSDRGAIGFQVHAGEAFKNMKITVKEVKLRPL